MTNNLVAVLPAYNAAEHISGVISKLLEIFPPDKIIVVDDGSGDGTGDIASRAGVRIVKHPRNLGKGAALRSGFCEALSIKGVEAIVVMDADGQHDPEDIPRLVEAFAAGGVELVVGNRMNAKGSMPTVRVATNLITSGIVSLLAGKRVPDSQNGFRLVATSLLRRIKLESNRYEIESELIIRASRAGARIASVPVKSIYAREKSAIHPVRDTLRFLKLVFRSLFW